MSAEITQFQAKDAGATDPESILAKVEEFITANELFELHGSIEEDVELETPRSDEKKLGRLTLFEQKCFVYGTLLDTYLKDVVIDMEVGAANEITEIMRNEKVMMNKAMELYMQRRNKDPNYTHLNKAASTLTFVMSAYEWSVRSRFDFFEGKIIVRTGFNAFRYE